MVVGAVALIALASPWAWRTWHEAHLTDGKNQIYSAPSAKNSVDLAMCLLKRRPDGLTLEISSQNHFVEPARQLVVELSAAGDHRAITAWAPQGRTLEPGEVAHLDSCR